MKVDLKKYELKFKFAAGTSRGILRTKPAWFLLFHSKNKTGIGEISRLPGLSFDDSSDFECKLNHIIADLNAGIDGEDLSNKTNTLPSIHFAIETALMDLKAHNHIYHNNDFTKGKTGIPINGLIWMGKKDEMLQQIDEKLNSGFMCLKMKIGAIDINTELEILKSIRKRYSVNELELRVDANGAFKRNDIMPVLDVLAKLNIHSIEQPIETNQREDMQNICLNSPIPVALDEELIGIFSYEKQIELLSFIKPQYIIVKPGLLGGFSMSQQWIDAARSLNIGFWITSSLESNVGLNAIAQWTSTLNTSMYQGLGTGSLYTNNIPSPLFINKDKLWFNPDNFFEIDFL